MSLNGIIVSVRSIWGGIENQLDRLAPLVDLVARLYIARVFWLSGVNKFQDWDSTLYLFQEEYQVPLLSPETAAYLGTAGELGFSVLLAAGLFTRFSACGLFFINIIAVISYYHELKDSPVAIQDHLAWGILLAILLVSRVKALTLDHLVPGRMGLSRRV